MCIFKSVYIATLLYGSESCFVLIKHVSRRTAAEMRYLRRSVWKTSKDRIRNAQIRKDLGHKPVRNIIDRK